MAKRPDGRKTGKPQAMIDEEAGEEETSESPLDAGTVDQFLEGMFGSKDYVHVKGQLPPIGWLKERFQTKSAIIRFLHSEDHEVKVIAKHTGFRYQMVRNVLTNELKRGPNENFTLPEEEEQGDGDSNE